MTCCPPLHVRSHGQSRIGSATPGSEPPEVGSTVQHGIQSIGILASIRPWSCWPTLHPSTDWWSATETLAHPTRSSGRTMNARVTSTWDSWASLTGGQTSRSPPGVLSGTTVLLHLTVYRTDMLLLRIWS